MKWTEWGVCIAIGIMAGSGFYTLRYAKGLSYLSNDPKACMNCHVMTDHYDSWAKSSHKKAASCNDCHIPHQFPQKYVEKALNGWNHSKAFTLQNFDEPIRITHRNLVNLQKNCVECHSTFVSEIGAHERALKGEARCTDCHRSVGHMSID